MIHCYGLHSEQDATQRLREENHGRKVKSGRHEEKLAYIHEYVGKTIAYIDRQQSVLEKCHWELGNSRKDHIKDLLSYIFPIRETQPRRWEARFAVLALDFNIRNVDTIIK